MKQKIAAFVVRIRYIPEEEEDTIEDALVSQLDQAFGKSVIRVTRVDK